MRDTEPIGEGALSFVESRRDYSVYRTRDGALVYLAHGRVLARYWVDWCNFDIDSEWRAWPDKDQDTFFEHLRALLYDDENMVDDLKWCRRCGSPDEAEHGKVVANSDAWVCDECIDEHYYRCDRCTEYYTSTQEMLTGEDVCDSCRNNDFTYCSTCEGYYRDGYEAEHTHEPDYNDCCSSPALFFAVRNDGEAPLSNDVRTTVTLPAGVIDEEGLTRIRRYLYGEDLNLEASVVESLGNAWQTREGNFTKRFSRAVYKQLARKVSPTVVSMIGTIAGEHSRSVDYTIEVTRDLNQSPGAFAHSDSCWWGSYESSRCALKSNGGFGLRTFNDSGRVTGRAWVLPVKLTGVANYLTPTFETLAPDGFVVFNGYGGLEGYTAARIVAHMAGMTYRKVGFSASPMYVNSESGYLVAPEVIAEGYTDGSLGLSLEQHASLFEDECTSDERENHHVA